MIGAENHSLRRQRGWPRLPSLSLFALMSRCFVMTHCARDKFELKAARSELVCLSRDGPRQDKGTCRVACA